MPPAAETAYQATAITMLILSTNWKRSVHSTPHRPPSATYSPVKGIRNNTQIARAAPSLPLHTEPKRDMNALTLLSSGVFASVVLTIDVIALVTQPRMTQFISRPR